MTELTFASIEEGLRQPFMPEIVKYLPKSPRKKESGEWVCLAFPYADKRAYEDRLNNVAFGYWCTPYNPPYAVGNKLVVPVTVMVFGIEHTDYGEAFLSSVSRKGEPHEAENSATEAYSQGFRRACAQFRLGRYFYTLPRIWVPYDPTTRMIAMSDEQRQRLTVRLYKQADLLPSRVIVQGGTTSLSEPVPTAMAPASVVPVLVGLSVPAEPDHGAQQEQQSSADPSQWNVPPRFSNPSQQRRWLEQQLKHNTRRIQSVCAQYHVQSLDHLSEAQFASLAKRIFASQQRAEHTRSNASHHTSSLQQAQLTQPAQVVAHE